MFQERGIYDARPPPFYLLCIRVRIICNVREHLSCSRYSFLGGAPIPRTKNAMRAVRTVRKVTHSRVTGASIRSMRMLVDAPSGSRGIGPALYACGTRNEKERIRIRVCAAAAGEATRGASASGEVTAVFVCRDAEEQKKKRVERGKGNEMRREKSNNRNRVGQRPWPA